METDKSFPLDVVIWDLDGTLANNNHRVGLVPGDGQDDSANWDKFSLAGEHDTPYEDMCQLARILKPLTWMTLIFSGRGAIAQEISEEWLRKQAISYDKFIMRPVGDFRDDREIKRDWYMEHRLYDHNVIVFDDRQKVVDMWRQMGVRCLQVQGGDF